MTKYRTGFVLLSLRSGGVVKEETKSAVKNEFLTHLDEMESGHKIAEVTLHAFIDHTALYFYAAFCLIHTHTGC